MKIFFITFIISSFFISSVARSHTIKFETSIETCLDIYELWHQFDLAMESSQNSSIWPNSSSMVEGNGLLEGEKIGVEYRFGFFRPIYTYRLKNVFKPYEFTYTAVGDHPFSGGAEITFIQENEITTIHWTGSYETSRGDFLRRMIFQRFQESFFNSLERKIYSYESSQCL